MAATPASSKRESNATTSLNEERIKSLLKELSDYEDELVEAIKSAHKEYGETVDGPYAEFAKGLISQKVLDSTIDDAVEDLEDAVEQQLRFARGNIRKLAEEIRKIMNSSIENEDEWLLRRASEKLAEIEEIDYLSYLRNS